MELMTATAEKTRHEAAHDLMSQCDAAVFLIAWCYGPIPDDEERSLLEIQYDWAGELGLPRLVYIIDQSQPVVIDRDFDELDRRWEKQGRLEAFKVRLRSQGGTANFTHENVAARLVHGLLEWRQRRLSTTTPGVSGLGSAGSDSEQTRREAEVVEALAEVYCESDDAVRAAKSAGFPRRMLPRFTTPLVFWSRLAEAARDGMLPGGIRPLIEGAARDYPNNEVFARFLREPEPLTVGPPPAAEPTPDSPPDLPSESSLGPTPRRRRRRTQTSPLDANLSRYLGQVERRNASATMLGASAPVEIPLDLDEVHTKVRIGSAESGSSSAARNHAVEIPLSEAFGRAEQGGYRGVALVGHPGSGKSTHLKRLALWLTRRRAAEIGLPADTVPLILPLRTVRDDVRGLDEAIGAHLEHELGFGTGFADEVLSRDHLLVLLDGFDDITDEARRARVLEWLAQGLHDHPGRRFFVTGRHPGDDEPNRLPPGLLEVQLPHLAQTVAQQLVHAWFIAAQGDAPDADREARRHAEALWAELRSPEFREARMFEMTRNPTLLSAMCVLYRERGSLPRRRVEFYEECLDVFIRRSQPFEGLPRRFGDREIRQVLQPLAHWMHGQTGRSQADTPAIVSAIEAPLEAALGYPIDGTRFLGAFRDEAGLLVPRDDHGYGFLHIGFQEYLCARHLRSLSHGDPTVLDALVERFGEPWWREVTILLLALGEPPLFDSFMRRLVERPSFVEHRDWVTDCIKEAAGASPTPFLELLEREPGDAPERWDRQLAAKTIVEAAWPDRLHELRLHGHPLEALRSAVSEGAPPRLETIRSARGAYPMVQIPAGRFTMGSHHREHHSRWIERPRHEVELEGFWMGLHPVTNEEYGQYLRACSDATEPSYWGDRRYNQPRQPVVGVSWHEAAAYCEWAGLTLPTEAQWEYACRAGTRTPYWAGRDSDCLEQAGWCQENSDQRLHPVAVKRPNAFGLYDVHGNVWEWCRDAFGDYRGHAPRAKNGLRHPAEDRHNRVIRGGSWIAPVAQARCAYRLNRHADDRLSYLGFRAILELDPDERE